MNIQIKRFGKNVKAFNPSVPNRDFFQVCEFIDSPINMSIEQESSLIRVCIYFDKAEVIPVSFIKSEQDLSGYVIEYGKHRYQCGKSRKSNSELFHTDITVLNERDLSIDFNAVN